MNNENQQPDNLLVVASEVKTEIHNFGNFFTFSNGYENWDACNLKQVEYPVNCIYGKGKK